MHIFNLISGDPLKLVRATVQSIRPTDYRSDARSVDEIEVDPCLFQSAQYTDVRITAGTASAQTESNSHVITIVPEPGMPDNIVLCAISIAVICP